MQNWTIRANYILLLGAWGNYASVLGITQTSRSFTVSQNIHDISSTPTPILTPFPTGDATANPACFWVSQELSFCSFVSPGFSTASYRDQRSCLCDRSTTVGQFTGAVFDEEVSLCADYAFTAQFSDYPSLTSLENLCSSTFKASTSGSFTIGPPLPSTAASTPGVTVTVTSATPVPTSSAPPAPTPRPGSSFGIQSNKLSFP